MERASETVTLRLEKKMRVAIAGGSIAGLFAASLLRRAGHEVEVFERSAKGLAGRGAGLVPQQEVYSILDRLGQSAVAETAVEASGRITLDRSGNIISELAHPQSQLSWDRLYMAVREQIPTENYHSRSAAVRAGTGRDGRPWLELSDGRHVNADLVIGADGLGSVVRPAIAKNFDVTPTYSGYVAWRFLVPETCLPERAAEVLAHRFSFYHGTGTQVLGYLVAGPSGETAPGSRRYNCVWYRQEADLSDLLVDQRGRPHMFSLPPGSLDEARRERLLRDARNSLPWPFVDVMEAELRPFIQAIFDMESHSMASGRLALVGDAAFVARPHTAMGAAKAAGDAMALADLFSRFEIDQALETYSLLRTRIGRAIVDYGRRLGAGLEPVASPMENLSAA